MDFFQLATALTTIMATLLALGGAIAIKARTRFVTAAFNMSFLLKDISALFQTMVDDHSFLLVT